MVWFCYILYEFSKKRKIGQHEADTEFRSYIHTLQSNSDTLERKLNNDPFLAITLNTIQIGIFLSLNVDIFLKISCKQFITHLKHILIEIINTPK